MRKIFPVCCAVATAPRANAATMAIRPTNFRFWILRLSSGQVLDCRLSEEEFGHRIQDRPIMLFSLNRKSAIENLKLFNDLVRPRQHVRRDRQADLLGGFQIDYQLELCRLL